MAIVVDLARPADYTRENEVPAGTGQHLLRQSVADVHIPSPLVSTTPPIITMTEDPLQPEITYATA